MESNQSGKRVPEIASRAPDDLPRVLTFAGAAMDDLAKLSQAAEKAAAGGLDSFEDELDEYDLLRSDTVSEAPAKMLTADLTGTTKAFNTRIQRKKKEQEVANDQAERAARSRHNLMFTALVNIRKALREIIRIDLGGRFEFQLIADDWFGWPRLAVRLHDTERPDDEHPQLVVTAHDRNASGTIEIAADLSTQPERISLTQEGEQRRLSALLRKCVRTYLDVVGDIVLQAEKNPEDAQDDAYLQRKDLKEFEAHGEPEPQESLTGDLFEEELHKESFMETLSVIEDIEALPDLTRK